MGLWTAAIHSLQMHVLVKPLNKRPTLQVLVKLGAAGSVLYTQGQQPLRQSSFKVAKVGHLLSPSTLTQPHITVRQKGTAQRPGAQCMDAQCMESASLHDGVHLHHLTCRSDSFVLVRSSTRISWAGGLDHSWLVLPKVWSPGSFAAAAAAQHMTHWSARPAAQVLMHPHRLPCGRTSLAITDLQAAAPGLVCLLRLVHGDDVKHFDMYCRTYYRLDVQVTDSTGAGDCYTAAFAVALLEGCTSQQALAFACAPPGSGSLSTPDSMSGAWCWGWLCMQHTRSCC